MLKRVALFTLIAVLVAACGTAATPQFTVAEATEEPTAEAQDTQPTSTPTDEPTVEPTAEPTEAPTEAPTAEPTEAPTDEPAEEPTAAEEDSAGDGGGEESAAEGVPAEEDPLALFIGLASAENGETLFNQSFDTPTGQWVCSTCHNVDVPEVKVGPSLLGIPDRAGSRVEGEGPYTYIYNSISEPGTYVVEGFGDGIMPHYAEVLTDAQIYDLVAYLMTLEE